MRRRQATQTIGARQCCRGSQVGRSSLNATPLLVDWRAPGDTHRRAVRVRDSFCPSPSCSDAVDFPLLLGCQTWENLSAQATRGLRSAGQAPVARVCCAACASHAVARPCPGRPGRKTRIPAYLAGKEPCAAAPPPRRRRAVAGLRSTCSSPSSPPARSQRPSTCRPRSSPRHPVSSPLPPRAPHGSWNPAPSQTVGSTDRRRPKSAPPPPPPPRLPPT
jgi:hypothetical protein